MKWHHKVLFVTFGIVVFGLIAGVWKEKLIQDQKPPSLLTGTLLPEAKSIPHFRLLDDHNDRFTEHQFKHHWNLLFFGYTQCPEICPTTLKVMAQVKQIVGFHSPFQMFMVSINPEGDTPEQLQNFLAQSQYHKGAVRGLTGDRKMIQKLADQIGLYVQEQIPDAGHIGHSGTLLVINPHGQLQALLTHPDDPFLIAQDLQKLMRFYAHS